VPDTRLQGILSLLADNGVRMRSLTREEECIGYAAGQRIAGQRPVVLMQSSGLGNSLNALGSLVVPYRLGLPLVVSMRGARGRAVRRGLCHNWRAAAQRGTAVRCGGTGPGRDSRAACQQLRVSSDSDLRRALGELERPSLIEAELTERAWPGPSPFVDPAQVRLAFAANAARTPPS
jgi:mRNA-degrading endonuclease toxin of MazEF toxin-antitoxin module